MKIDAKTKLCCIIGNPVEHSLSPQMYNAAFEALNLNYVFTAFRVINLKRAIEGLRAVGVCGIVVTVPYKIEVMKYLDEIENTAKEIGAVNTIINKNGRLTGTNTDWIAGIKALEEQTVIAGKKVAILGAGGAAYALTYGLKKKKAKIFVFNRTYQKASALVKRLGLESAYQLAQFDKLDKLREMDIIINTTSVGMHPQVDESPIPDDCITRQHTVFDIVYTPKETKLIKSAKQKKATVAYGDKMVLNTAIEIFQHFTGQKAPVKVMEEALYAAFSHRG